MPCPTPESPTGSLLSRGLTAVFVDRKLPYSVTRWGDRLLRSVGLKYRTVVADGLRFQVRRGAWADEAVLRHVIGEREYHPPGYEVGPDDVVIDVGANIGAFSVLAARKATNGRVIAFEPEPDNFALLCENLSRNGCENVTPVRAAVTDRAGIVTLNLNADSGAGHSLHRDPSGRGVSVPAMTLADVFDAYAVELCDFLKLDCEGAEYDILYTLPRNLFGRVRRVALEYHADPAVKRDRGDELVAFLRGVGFRVDQYTSVVGSRNGLVFATRDPAARKPR